MDNLDLARRLVACPGYRPCPGMLGVDGSRLQLWECGAPAGIATIPTTSGRHEIVAVYRDFWLPDLDDRATVGCVEALVQEAWGEDAHLSPEWDVERGVVVAWSATAMAMYAHGWVRVVDLPRGPTRIEAMIAALEAAKDGT